VVTHVPLLLLSLTITAIIAHHLAMACPCSVACWIHLSGRRTFIEGKKTTKRIKMGNDAIIKVAVRTLSPFFCFFHVCRCGEDAVRAVSVPVMTSTIATHVVVATQPQDNNRNHHPPNTRVRVRVQVSVRVATKKIGYAQGGIQSAALYVKTATDDGIYLSTIRRSKFSKEAAKSGSTASFTPFVTASGDTVLNVFIIPPSLASSAPQHLVRAAKEPAGVPPTYWAVTPSGKINGNLWFECL
jgi:hypothetical protein